MRKREKKSKKFLWIFIIILLIIVIAGIAAGIFLNGKLSNLNFLKLDNTQLGANENLYNEISDKISKEEYNNIRKIVLFGIDNQCPEYEGDSGRTDCIMVVAINSKTKQIKMVSIPRDTYVDIEDHGKDKINQAYAIGKEQLSIKTINQNFGLDLTEFITIDFAGLANVINDIGGIELKITYDEMQFINSENDLAYELSSNRKKVLTSYGNVLLDGEQALTHSRNRKVGDDFTRASRQRDVIQAIMNKISKMEPGKILDTIEILLKEVTTNINIGDYMGLLSDVLINKSIYLGSITSAQVPTREYAKDQYINGIYYFVVDDPQLLKEKMIDYIYIK